MPGKPLIKAALRCSFPFENQINLILPARVGTGFFPDAFYHNRKEDLSFLSDRSGTGLFFVS